MKKFMVSITIVMAMIVAMFGIGSEKAFAATRNEERVAYTEIDKIDEEMNLIEAWAIEAAETYGVKVVEQGHRIYKDEVVYGLTVEGVDGVEADAIVYSFDDVHFLAEYCRSWMEAAKLADWQ